MPNLNKIDDQGNYLEFPGVSIVAHVGQANLNLWQKIHRFLQNTPALRNYFSPLPYQSYHMTTCDLYTKEDTAGDWIHFISQNLQLFQKLNRKLSELKFTPTIAIENIYFFPALQLVITIPPEQRMIIQRVASEFGLENKIPAEFHITLAYGYNEIEDEDSFKEIKNKIGELLTICHKYEQPITLSPPELCFFHTMEQFIPWDGSTNPFIPQRPADRWKLFNFKNGLEKEGNDKNANSKICLVM